MPAEVVVIGAGFGGLAAVRRLARVPALFSRQLQRIKERGPRNYRRSMLVIVENWNIHNFFELIFYIETIWSFDVFKIYSTIT